MDTNTRLNHLAVEYTQTALDAAYLVQRQNIALAQSWYHTLETNQQASRDLVGKLVKQSQEAQSLWLGLIQDSFRTGAETVARMTQTQFQEMNDQVQNFTRQATNGTKRAESAAEKAADKPTK